MIAFDKKVSGKTEQPPNNADADDENLPKNNGRQNLTKEGCPDGKD